MSVHTVSSRAAKETKPPRIDCVIRPCPTQHRRFEDHGLVVDGAIRVFQCLDQTRLRLDRPELLHEDVERRTHVPRSRLLFGGELADQRCAHRRRVRK